MRRKREPVVESVAINSAYRAGAIIGTPDTVVVAQGAEGEIKIAQSFPQQGIGDIKRDAGGDLATQSVGGHYGGFAGAADPGNVGQRIGAAIDLRRAALIAVNKQIDA